jgi:hypothetical protein
MTTWSKYQKIVIGLGVLAVAAYVAVMTFASEQVKAAFFYGMLALWMLVAIAERFGIGERIARRIIKSRIEARQARWKAKLQELAKTPQK